MRTILILILTSLVSAAAEIPVGEVMKFNFTESKIYPGTMRDVWVYVPKQYDGRTPACLWVNQDGIQFGAVKIDKEGKVLAGGAFDKLIAEKKMPVTIGVFVRPGVAKALIPNALDRVNRSYEYDSLGDNYAKFLIEELLPAVEKMSTPDGRKIVLSKDPNDRGIGGSSSGAICAFTVAWERPDSFRRVFSSIGSYADLRGGHNYPNLIRKMEPKPLRIFLEDGSGDLNNYAGDWWLGNQQMEKALKFMGYEVESKWGTGGHDAKHATEIFPDALSWLWKDHPQPVKTGECKNDYLKEILVSGEDWKTLNGEFVNIYSLTSSPNGLIYFQDSSEQIIYKCNGKQFSKFINYENKPSHLLNIGGDKRLYLSDTKLKKIESWDLDDITSRTYIENIHTNRCLIMHDNTVYVVPHPIRQGEVILRISKDLETSSVAEFKDTGINRLITNLDKSQLLLSSQSFGFISTARIKENGDLDTFQIFAKMIRTKHAPQDPYLDRLNAYGMVFDNKGRLWIATSQGIQISDQEGRIHCVLRTPNGISLSIAFGGPEFNNLYVASENKVYFRKLNAKGVNAFDPPQKPVAPKK